MRGSQQLACTDEARPLGLGWANPAVAYGVGADHEAGCDGCQHSRELDDLPRRTVLKLKARKAVEYGKPVFTADEFLAWVATR